MIILAATILAYAIGAAADSISDAIARLAYAIQKAAK